MKTNEKNHKNPNFQWNLIEPSLKKAKIVLLSSYIPVLLGHLNKINWKKYFKENHSKKFKSSHNKLMKTIIKTQNVKGTWENLHEKGQNWVVQQLFCWVN